MQSPSALNVNVDVNVNLDVNAETYPLPLPRSVCALVCVGRKMWSKGGAAARQIHAADHDDPPVPDLDWFSAVIAR
jgi:hypothetical protein